MNNWLSRVPQKCWAYTALLIWAALCFMLLHKTSYGIDEGAAQALLLVWSIADNVVSPIVTLGFPDFRALFLAPVGFLWTGDVLPAKVTTILVTATAAWALHTWRIHKGESESALLATGLLMIRLCFWCKSTPFLLLHFCCFHLRSEPGPIKFTVSRRKLLGNVFFPAFFVFCRGYFASDRTGISFIFVVGLVQRSNR